MVPTDCQSPLPDAEVVERVQAGEVGLYELLMRRYNQRLFRVIRSVIADDLEAEDVLQDAWCRAFEHLGQFEGRSSFATWVTKIAFYEALTRARRRKRLVALEDADGEMTPEAERLSTNTADPEKQAMQGELGQILSSAVDRLPITYRSVFMLRAVEQLSTAETAECLNLSEEAVKTRLHRSRSLLRQDLQTRLGPAIVESYCFMGHRCDRTVAAVMERIRNDWDSSCSARIRL
jgi:RNA polymerase sigma-70 factor, ECF subfamily